MLGFSSYAVNLVMLKSLWSLSNTESGLIASGFFLGYMACVSMWSAMTDRRDARGIYGLGCLLSTLASASFALLADDFFSAFVCQIALGVGVSATYMPGLRLLSEMKAGASQSRYVSFYTAFFGLGVALSLLLSGWASETFGWRWSFAMSASGPLLAWVLVWTATRPKAGPQTQSRPLGAQTFFEVVFPVRAWSLALHTKPVRGYMLGYGVHCLELFAARSWTVAFLTFSIGLQSEAVPVSAAALAALINLVSIPSSILGNELAMRVGRRFWIVLVMCSGSVVGVLMGLLSGAPWWFVVLLVGLHSMLIMADSATLTAGLVASAPAEVKGAAMGLYSLLGFGAGAVGPALFGAALDASGGSAQPVAWALAFLCIGVGCLAYPFMDRLIFGRFARPGS